MFLLFMYMYKIAEVFIGSTKLPFREQDFCLAHKFRKWLDQKFKILKIWLDILIPLILLIEKHPLLEF